MSRDWVIHFKPTRDAKWAYCGASLDHSWSLFPEKVECRRCGNRMGLLGRPCDILTSRDRSI